MLKMNFLNYLGFKCYLLPVNLRGGNKLMAGGNLGAISVKYMARCDVTKGSLTNSRTRYFSTHLLTKGNRSLFKKTFLNSGKLTHKRHRLL